MFKGVIFDFNGTLFDDSAIHIKVWEQLYEKITEGKGYFDHFAKTVLGTPNATLIARMGKEVNKSFTAEEIEDLSELKEKMYRDYAIDNNLCQLIKGANRLMDEIKTHELKMNLCSASIKPNIDFFFSEFGIGRWFEKDNVVYDDGSTTDKKVMYKKAAENIGCQIEECLIFEDSDYGAKCAIEVGAKVILIDRLHIKEDKDGIIQIVYDFDEVDRHLIFD